MDTSGNNHLDNNIKSENEHEYFSAIPYKFRFTFSDQDDSLECLKDKAFIGRCKMIHRCLINKLSDNHYFYMDKFTSGFEVRSKGEDCRAHIHINFRSTHLKNSMNRTIKRLLVDEFNQEYYGNKCYSFKEELGVRDEEKFYRYPLKQGLNPQLCRGFSKDKLEQMHQVARDSYTASCQVFQAKMDNKDKDDTLFLRVLTKIKKNNDNTKRAIAKTFYQHYFEEDRPINKTVIEGYVLNALLKLNLITIDDLISLHGY